MSHAHLARIADRVLNRPLAILPDKLALIASVLDGRIGLDAAGLTVDAERLPGRHGPDASSFIGSREPVDANDPRSKLKAYRTTGEGVAIVPVIGSLVNRYSWLDAASGVTSYEHFKHVLGQIGADAVSAGGSVTGCVLDMDTPGGEAVGCFEAAEAVRALAAIMPVTAVVNGMACSAGYAIASAATKIVTTPSGISGSIGVVMLHADYSHRLHEAGVKPTLIHAGKYKVDGSPYVALTDDVRDRLKAEIERFNDLFIETVAKGRSGLTPQAIRDLEAATKMGADAVALGLADEVGTFETALAGIPGARSGRSSNAGRISMETATATAPVALTQADVDTARTAGHAAGIEAGKAEGLVAGATAERARIKTILSGDEAKGREASAQHLAFATDMTAEAATAVLAGLDKAAPAATLDARASLQPALHSGGDHLAPRAGGQPAQDGAASWDDVATKHNASRGFKPR